jgi:hypothetical protein
MSRVTVVVDKELLKSCIKEVESKGPLLNRSILQDEVTKMYNIKKTGEFTKITTSIVYLRIKEFGIEVITPSGRKGRSGGVPRTATTGIHVSKAERFKGNKAIQESFALIRAATPERFQPLVDKLEAGSRAAADKLRCLECCNYTTKEVCLCSVMACPVWAYRPYQSKVELEEEGIIEETEEVETPE